MKRRKSATRNGLALGAALALAALACSGDSDARPRKAAIAPPVPVPEARGLRDVAVLSIEDFGEVRIELLHDLAPRTVDNFVELAEQGFYDGTHFHRVVPDFAIQGGDPLSKDRDPRNDGQGDPGYTIDDEFSDVSHRRGVVSMANRGRAHSAGSQFFVTLEESRSLDGKYAVFGHVLDGMDVVDRIAQVERDAYGRRGPRDRPLEPVVIERVRIERGAGGRQFAAEDEAEPDAGESGLRFSESEGVDAGQAPREGLALPASAAPEAP